MATIDPIVKKQRFLYPKNKNRKTFFFEKKSLNLFTHVLLAVSGLPL